MEWLYFLSWICSTFVSFFRSIVMSSDSHCSTLCPRFNKRSDVEATTRLASEAMPTHNPYTHSPRLVRSPISADSSTN